ncbi:ribonuclease H-like domain-containing protein [Tanacetum coccineum]
MSANDNFSLHDDEELSLHDDASLDGSVPASNKGDAPAKPQQIITTNTLSNIKLPVLQKDDYDTWAMEMEHYLEYIDNEVWKVIQNGNSKKRVTKGKDGVYRVLPSTTQEEQFAEEKERKARTLLLMAIPKDHLRRFHGMDDAKEIWAAIKTRFGGNANSKKMQKAVLKQQFEAFTISSKESLEKGYDRFQKLLSQLDALGAGVSDEDANHKFLRSLPPAWDSLAMTMRTKKNIDTLSIDDLYNNLSVFEQDIQKTSSSSLASDNVAFLSQAKASSSKHKPSHSSGSYSSYTTSSSKATPTATRSCDEVIHSFLATNADDVDLIHEDLDQIDDLDLEEMDINWQIAMTAIKIKKFYKKTGRRPRVDGKMHVAFDKRKVECFNCHNTGHFARECKFKGSKEGNRQEAGKGQNFKPVQIEKEALMTIDEGQINWVEQTTDEELNHALMAFTVNNEVSMCSKLCLDSYNALQAKYDELQSEFGDQEAALVAHKIAVKKLESQLKASHKQQSSLTEKLNFQANQIFEKDEKLKKYRRIGMKAVKDKDALQQIFDSWSASSKNLWKLIDCGMSSTVKIGLGYGIKSNAEVLGYEEEISRGIFASRETDAGYNDIPLYSRFKQVEYKGVPHPLSGDYTPREQEDIDDSLYEYGKYGPQPQSPSPTVSDTSSTVYSTCQSNDSDGELGAVSDHSVNDDPIHDHIPIPFIEQVTIATQKTQPQVPKPKQIVVPSCAQHVKTPSHLIKDCDYYEKKMAREAALKGKRVVHANVRQATPVWTNTNRVNKANQFTLRPVQLSTIRPNLSIASKTIKPGRVNINTGHGNGKMGTAFKTSAGCVWRKAIPLSNINSGPTLDSNVNDHPLKHMEHRGIFDSGCSGHMTGNRAHLEDYQELSKLCPNNVMRRWVAGDEIREILAHCHSGPTGGPHSVSITGRKVYESGFFWPSIFKDAKYYIMRCDECQRSGNISSRRRYSVSVPALNKDHKVNKIQYAVSKEDQYAVFKLWKVNILEDIKRESVPAQVVAAAKLPVLNTNEFELWKMRIEQYFLMTDYALWEVIVNGDSPPNRFSMPSIRDLTLFCRRICFCESVINVPAIATSEVKTSESKPKFVSEPLIKDWISDSEDENETKSKSKQRKPSFAKIEFVKSNEHVKTHRESVKKVENNKRAEYPRRNSQSPRAVPILGFKKMEQFKIDQLEVNLERFKIDQAAINSEAMKHWAFLQATIEKNKVEADQQFAEIMNALKALQPPTTLPATIPHFEENSRKNLPLTDSTFKDLDTEDICTCVRVLESVNSQDSTNPTWAGDQSRRVEDRVTWNPEINYHPSERKWNFCLNSFIESNIMSNHVFQHFRPDDRYERRAVKRRVWDPGITGALNQSGSYHTVRPKAVGNPQQDLKDKGIINSGCSRHMTRNRSYLTDYEDIDGGFIAFRGSTKGGKITGKGFSGINYYQAYNKNCYFISSKKKNDSHHNSSTPRHLTSL